MILFITYEYYGTTRLEISDEANVLGRRAKQQKI